MRRAKRLAKRSTVLTTAAGIALNTVAPWQMGRLSGGLQSASQTPEEAVAYIHRSFEDILRMGGMTPGELQGARILELGPGDTLGLALRMVAAGAEYVCAVDRFSPRYDPAHQARIYELLRADLSPAEQARFDTAVTISATGAVLNQESVELRQGEGIETIELPPRTFDLIMSIAVCEHLTDPRLACVQMHALLKPSGVMLHQVDLRDHHMFTESGKHPLTWLTIPTPVFRRMTSNRGSPNRYLVNVYRELFTRLGYALDVQITNAISRPYDENLADAPRQLVRGNHYDAADVEALDGIRGRLRPQFRFLSDEDLMTSGVFLRADKPRA